MEQEPILKEHNFAESESRANPVCYAEPKQGHELNAHNKQEYPPMHTRGFNTSVILLLLPILMMVISCHRNNEQNIRQTYYIDDNTCVCLRPIQSAYGDKAEIVVTIGDKEGVSMHSFRRGL